MRRPTSNEAKMFAPTGRECKQALVRCLSVAAHEFLVTMARQDLADDMLALDAFDFEIQSPGTTEKVTSNQFYIRAKPLNGDGSKSNRPAIQFEVTITGGG